MLEQFKSFLFENCLGGGETKVLLAVSGGIDSMAMINLFTNISGIKIGVAHCNFQLRASESDKDELLVMEVCNKNEITFHHKSFNTAEYAKSNGLSIQMAARELRYQWFNELLNEYAYDVLATGHHKGDVIETMLLNLIRGTGIAGLHGIKPRNGKFIRPLLFCGRNDIMAYAKNNNLVWNEDSSNQKNDYARNKIRNQVVPILEEINPSVIETFITNANHFSDAEVLLKEFIEVTEKKIIREEQGVMYMLKNELLALPYFKNFISVYLSGLNFNDTVIADLITSIQSQIGKRFYSKSHQLLIDRDELIISSNIDLVNTCAIAYEGEEIVHCNHFDLQFSLNKLIQPLQFTKEKDRIVIAIDKLNFPLRVRPWEAGDVFRPFGMKGKKKVSDYLIDEKINRFEKAKTMVLTSGEEIAWVIGHRLDGRFKLDSATKEYLEIKIKPTT